MIYQVNVNSFATRQHPRSRFSSFSLDSPFNLMDLADYAEEQLDIHGDRPFPTVGKVRAGYRSDIALVEITDPSILCHLRTAVIVLSPGDALQGIFASRVEGEAPRKSIWAENSEKMPAKSAFVVCYSSIALAEDGSNELPPVLGNYEIISLNASPLDGDMPIAPDVLIANHLQESGGTATNMTDKEFVAQLRISRAWWSDKVGG